MKDFRTWIYHKTKKEKIVMSSEAEAYYADGWKDSPAEFKKIEDFGGDPNNPSDVQQIGEAIEGVRDAANGALNIDEFTKKQLVDYAKKHFGVELDINKNKLDDLKGQVRELLNPDETLN